MNWVANIGAKCFDGQQNKFGGSSKIRLGSLSRWRFAREAQTAAAVVHENVIAIHGVAESQGRWSAEQVCNKRTESTDHCRSDHCRERAEATQRLRAQLTIVVTESFDLRQELQKAELTLLRERIHRIDSQVSQREVLRDAIVKQRVDQLVSRPPLVSVIRKLKSATSNLTRSAILSTAGHRERLIL